MKDKILVDKLEFKLTLDTLQQKLENLSKLFDKFGDPDNSPKDLNLEFYSTQVLIETYFSFKIFKKLQIKDQNGKQLYSNARVRFTYPSFFRKKECKGNINGIIEDKGRIILVIKTEDLFLKDLVLCEPSQVSIITKQEDF